MKNILIAAFILLLTQNVFAQEVIRLSEPVHQTDEFEIFGANIDFDSITPMVLSQAVEKPDEEIFVVTEVREVCAKKGCFFIAQDGDLTARVTFKDYGFFIPTNSAGKEVILSGTLTEKVISEEQAKHYAEDAGTDPDLIQGDQKEYSIVATSVIVPKS